MKVQYRNHARQALARAERLLASIGDDVLRYVALELRMAMEALTYDRAQAYLQEIPPEELATWQPRKVMQLLLEIEPAADKSYTLRIGEEPAPGVAPERMTTLGTDSVFDMAALRIHYDAVGSILHMPTMRQMQDGKPLDLAKWRKRCEQIVSELTVVLDSPVWNFTMGTFVRIDCFKCGKVVRKRWLGGDKPVPARCFHCGAQYVLTPLKDGQVHWEALWDTVKCQTEGCTEVFEIWRHEMMPGTTWQCSQCQQHYRIDCAIFRYPDSHAPA